MAKDKSKAGHAEALESAEPPDKPKKLKSKVYLEELAKLQIELSKLQEWVKAKGLKVVVVKANQGTRVTLWRNTKSA